MRSVSRRSPGEVLAGAARSMAGSSPGSSDDGPVCCSTGCLMPLHVGGDGLGFSPVRTGEELSRSFLCFTASAALIPSTEMRPSAICISSGCPRLARFRIWSEAEFPTQPMSLRALSWLALSVFRCSPAAI